MVNFNVRDFIFAGKHIEDLTAKFVNVSKGEDQAKIDKARVQLISTLGNCGFSLRAIDAYMLSLIKE